MAKEFAKAFYDSKAWKCCRAAYISYRKSLDGGMCENCREMSGYIIHHKIELSPSNINNPDITLNFENLKYLCHNCHNKEHTRIEVADGLAQYTFDKEGNVVELPPKNNC